MSTAPVSTKPDEQRVGPEPSREEERERPGQAPRRSGSDRDVDSDLLLDIPQLRVEGLTLDLEASLLLNHVKLDANGLETSLYLKADLDLLRPLIQKGAGGAGNAERRGSRQPRGADTGRVPGALRELLGATRDAYRQLSEHSAEPPPRDVETTARDVGEQDHAPAGEHDGRANAALERARGVAVGGAKAAGLTAAGLAGGALLESRTKATRKLPIPRRRNRAQAIGHEIVKRLP